MNIVQSALGHYEVTGNPDDADCVIGNSFGTSVGENSVNRLLATLIIVRAKDRPIIADRTLVNAFPDGDAQVAHVVEGPVTNNFNQGVGTWGTLVEAKQFMESEGLEHAMMTGQAHHIGRIAMQSDKLDIRFSVPANLPDQFDSESEQPWTRSLLLWLPREILGSLVLRAQNQI